ncbi:ATPase [Kordiimonas sediminis]|uniref:ATPase n=1 Tax=Kordiimonas sediminis TaxID=1735581 RepID=A0A919E8E8_9PROT|nr:ATP12 family protein [Kordiimonas sediminis]GHF24627.1 ATPase [Kordiimonas sediminis]
MKRFYKTVIVVPADGGHKIQLDGRDIRTPKRSTVVVPSERLATAMADEWAAQEDTIKPEDMHLNRLANTAIDRVATQKDAVVDELVGYAQSDLICYRADHPKELVARQAKEWDPVLDWVRDTFGVDLKTTTGVLHVAQSDQDVQRIKTAIDALDAYEVSGLHALTTGFGSVALALACLREGRDFEACWTASRVDEDFQRDKWGADAEADAVRNALYSELKVADKYLKLLKTL